VNPVYISPGHLIDLETAIDLTLRCDGGYRLPEPTRRAHLLVNALRRGERDVE
jgi:deoxyribonuclease V